MNSTIKCVILDDEMLAISYLKLLCEQMPGVEVVKAFNNPKLFLEEIDHLDCNVCILDIEMPGLNGLQVAELIEGKKIIFTTAYKEYAAEAFDLDVIDYVRKPIKKERLQQAFEKAREILDKKQNRFIEWNTNLGKSIIFTNTIAFIRTSEIDSRDKDIFLDDQSVITLKNINFKTLSELLPEKEFVQINKQEIIALKAIKVFSNNEIITNISIDSGNVLKLHITEIFRPALLEIFGK